MLNTSLPPGAFTLISAILIMVTFAWVVISIIKAKPRKAILSIVGFSFFLYFIITVVKFIYGL